MLLLPLRVFRHRRGWNFCALFKSKSHMSYNLFVIIFAN